MGVTYGNSSEPPRKKTVCLIRRLRNITSAAADVRPQTGHWSTSRAAPQSRQRVIQVSIPSARRFQTGLRLRKFADQLLVGLVLFLWKGNRYAHAESGFDAAYPAVHTDRMVELKVR